MFSKENGGWIRQQSKKRNNTAGWAGVTTVFVNNLPEFALVYWLREMCSWFGKVVDAFIPESSRRGTGKCFGFVQFREERLAVKCIEALCGSNVDGR